MADEDALIAKAAEALAPWLPRPTRYTDDETRALLTENVEHVARAVVAAVRDQIAAQAWDEGNAQAQGYDLSYPLDRGEWEEESLTRTLNPYRKDQEADRA